jgi:hypothetical protein
MTYNFIHDPEQMKIFEGLFFKSGKMYLTYMAARKKYCTEISNKENGCFNRKIINKKDDEKDNELYNTVIRYEIKKDSYCSRDKKFIFPEQSIALYTSINSRNYIKATQELTKEIIEKIFENNMNMCSKIDCIYKSNLQKYCDKEYITIDVDLPIINEDFVKDREQFMKIYLKLSIILSIYCIIETRGGYHIIIKKTELTGQTGKYIYNDLKKEFPVIDKLDNDMFSPIPGTYQGGFKVKLLYYNRLFKY